MAIALLALIVMTAIFSVLFAILATFSAGSIMAEDKISNGLLAFICLAIASTSLLGAAIIGLIQLVRWSL